MRLTLFPAFDNPIAMREMRLRQHGKALFFSRAETIAVVAAALTICVYLITRWLAERAALPLGYIYQYIDFHHAEYTQTIMSVCYALVLLRCTAAGVSVTNRLQRQTRDDVLATSIKNSQIIWGQWSAALYQVRGWMLALGLIRIAVFVLAIADFQFNIYWNDIPSFTSCCFSSYYYVYSPLQHPIASTICILLCLLEVWASTGIGILIGNWVRNTAVAWLIASALRFVPILIFSSFPIINVFPNSFDLYFLRWREYTWFAFADGGTGAMLRLAQPTFTRYFEGNNVLSHALLAFFAAFHMLLILGTASYALTALSLRWGEWKLKTKLRHYFVKLRSCTSSSLENMALVVGGFVICLFMGILWLNKRSYRPDTLGQVFFYDPTFVASLYSILGLAIAVTTIRAVFAGVHHAHTLNHTSLNDLSFNNIFFQGWHILARIRGWGFTLASILMTGFALLITEHMVNFYTNQLVECSRPQLTFQQYPCGYTHFGWLPSQWLFGLTLPILLSGTVLLSSVFIGIGAGTLFRSSGTASLVGLSLRALPVFLGFLLPDAATPDATFGILVIRWYTDPLLTIADTGISALFGLAEPYRSDNALTQIGFGMLSFTLNIYLLLAYTLLSIGLTLWLHRRRIARLSLLFS